MLFLTRNWKRCKMGLPGFGLVIVTSLAVCSNSWRFQLLVRQFAVSKSFLPLHKKRAVKSCRCTHLPYMENFLQTKFWNIFYIFSEKCHPFVTWIFANRVITVKIDLFFWHRCNRSGTSRGWRWSYHPHWLSFTAWQCHPEPWKSKIFSKISTSVQQFWHGDVNKFRH